MSPTFFFFFFFNDTATTEIYTLSLHDALPIYTSTTLDPHKWLFDIGPQAKLNVLGVGVVELYGKDLRSEEHTSELQSRSDLVCRLLLEKKKKKQINEKVYQTNTDTNSKPYRAS